MERSSWCTSNFKTKNCTHDQTTQQPTTTAQRNTRPYHTAWWPCTVLGGWLLVMSLVVLSQLLLARHLLERVSSTHSTFVTHHTPHTSTCIRHDVPMSVSAFWSRSALWYVECVSARHAIPCIDRLPHSPPSDQHRPL